MGDKSDNDLFHVAGTISTDLDLAGAKTRVDALLGYATGDHQLRVNTVDLADGTRFSKASQFNASNTDMALQATFTGWLDQAWSVQPRGKLGLNVFHQDAAHLGTGNEADILVQEREQSRGYVELGAVFDKKITDRIGAFGRISGVQYFGDTETAFVSSFIDAPVGTQSFRTIGDTVEQQLEIDANLSILLPQNFHLSAGGFAEIGDLEVQGAQISLVKKF